MSRFAPHHAEANPEPEVDNQIDDPEPVVEDGKLDWKSLIVAALKVTEKLLDGSPIPAAKGCISVVLQVIEATDVAADNEEVLKELQSRYQEFTEFLLSISNSVPDSVKGDMTALQKKLKKLADRWAPRLTKHTIWDKLVNVFKASSERDMFNQFLTKLNQAMTDFLLRTQVQISISAHRDIVANQRLADMSKTSCARYAAYNTTHPGKGGPCLGDTRQSVRKRIMDWAKDLNLSSSPIFWLNGLAGIGKTTIAYSIAKELDDDHMLGGSFLFLRQHEELSDGKRLFPTLAFQLSSFDPEFKTKLAEILGSDPHCADQSPETQFEKLILQPLSAMAISKPLILVLDALDECQDEYSQEILSVIVEKVRDVPFLRFFVTSRPEGYIRETLGVGDSNSARQTLVLHEDMHVQEEVEEDIKSYLQVNLQRIWARKNQGEWPSERDLKTLVEHSGKLFIYAATMVRFMDFSRSLDLERQLKCLLDVKVGHIPSHKSYKRLDQLYLDILDVALAEAFREDTYYIDRFRNVVGSIVLWRKPLSLEALSRFLGDYTVSAIEETLYYLHSIIIVPSHPSHAPRTYHKSFPDFITNAARCTNEQAYVHPSKQELYLFVRCLLSIKGFFEHRVLLKGSRTGVRQVTRESDYSDDEIDDGDLAESSYNEDNDSGDESANEFYEGGTQEDSVDNFYEQVTLMPPEVQYSCSHWCSHLVKIQVNLASNHQSANLEKSADLPADEFKDLIEVLTWFLNDYLQHWLDDRIARISRASDGAQVKLSQDTLDVMYNAYHWMAIKIESQSGDLRRILKSRALEAFTLLSHNGTWKYTFGGRIRAPVPRDPYAFRPRKRDVFLNGVDRATQKLWLSTHRS